MYTATTRAICVTVQPRYLPEQSDPAKSQFVWAYQVRIENKGDVAVQLRSRHWKITDGLGRRQEVKGRGVVGETPRLEPGQAFKYQSFCPLGTTWGTMEGSYTMQRDDGETFEATIGRFYLRLPSREPAAGAR